MAINEKLTDSVREILAHVANVEEKKMFGGIANDTDLERWINYGLEFGEKSS